MKPNSHTQLLDMKADWKRWEAWADVLRFGTLGLLLVSLIALNALDKEFARSIIWYWAGGLFSLATAGFILGHIANKKMSAYFKALAPTATERQSFREGAKRK
jgi:hypothetical protein